MDLHVAERMEQNPVPQGIRPPSGPLHDVVVVPAGLPGDRQPAVNASAALRVVQANPLRPVGQRPH